MDHPDGAVTQHGILEARVVGFDEGRGSQLLGIGDRNTPGRANAGIGGRREGQGAYITGQRIKLEATRAKNIGRTGSDDVLGCFCRIVGHRRIQRSTRVGYRLELEGEAAAVGRARRIDGPDIGSGKTIVVDRKEIAREGNTPGNKADIRIIHPAGIGRVTIQQPEVPVSRRVRGF